MRGSEWARFVSMVKAAQGVTHTHRYRTTQVTATQGAVTAFPLLVADDDPDYDVGGDFSTAAECHANSRIEGIDLNLMIAPNATSEIVEWMIFKDPDAIVGTGADPATLFDQDVSANALIFRKYVMAYGMFRSTVSREATRIHVRITRAALKRAGVMKDNDVLRLHVKNTGGSATTKISAYGRIWTRL